MSEQRPVRAAEAVLGLWRAAGAGRLSHALLFHGPEGVGKFLAARWFARGLLCERGPGEPCGTCGPCKRVAVATHPDLHVVDPRAEGEETLKVERVARREGAKGPPSVGELLSLRPGEGGWRVVLLRDFDLAGPAAQNALLKTLEEPGERTLLVLVTSRPERLLDTVRSRCVGVRFGSLTRAECQAVLEDQGAAPEAAARLARWSGGSPGLALALGAAGADDIRAALGALLTGQQDPLDAARAIEAVEAPAAGKTPAARERAQVLSALDLGLALLGDLVRWEAGVAPGHLAHGDWIEAHAGALSAWRPPALEAGLGALLEAQLDLGANLNAGGVLDRALLALARARRAG